ncbi:MAG: Ig-like domain-containing protein [Planctomycetota bacterium]
MRRLLASDFTNPDIARDVTGDENVSALDALRVINELNRQGGSFDVPETPSEVTDFFDVNGDRRVSALDALVVINSLSDETPPTLTIGLANDTGLDGTDDDGVTSDATLSGVGTDPLGIAFFTVQVNEADPVRFFPTMEDVLHFEPGFATDGSDDGFHRLTVTATDGRGLVSEPLELFVELDTQVESAAIEDFAVDDHGDGLVTLFGASEPGSEVKLGDQTATNRDDFSFQVPGVAVTEGTNAFTLEVTDRAGNQRTFEQNFDLVEQPDVEIDLQSDTARGGAENTDRLTRFPTVVGRVRDLSAIAKVSAGINTEDVSQFVELTDLLTDSTEDDGATFEIDVAAFARIAGGDLPDGDHRLHVMAEDIAGNASEVASTFFTFDSQSPGITIASPLQDQVIGIGDQVSGQIDLFDPTAELKYRIGDGIPKSIAMDSNGNFSTSLDLRDVPDGPTQIIVTAEDAAGNIDEVTVDVDIQVVVPFQLTNTFPASGQSSVGVTFKPSVQFASPVDPTAVTPDSVFLSTGGVKLDANVVVSDDGLQATIFPQANLPSSSTISLTVDGDQIISPDGMMLDGNFDDEPGGLFRADFTTLNMAPIPNTAVVGRVISPGPDNLPFTADDSEPGDDGIRGTDDDVFLLPLAGVEVNLQGGSQVVTTDDQGFYRLDQVPIGEVIVAVHGGTATNIPDDVFYPEFQKRATVFPGQDNTIDGGMFNLFLPRLDKRILRTVSNATGAVITGDDISAPDLPPELRSQLRVEIAPGSLRDAFGNPVEEAQVGIQTVPPELIIDGMPLGLQLIGLDQVITVQALGVRRFAQPARVSMPNLSGSAPGERLDFLSFDHDQGELLREGAFVVSADGQTITTEEGAGIIHPGWHPPSRPGSLLSGNVSNNKRSGTGNNASADNNAADDSTSEDDVEFVNPNPDVLTSEADRRRVLSKKTTGFTLEVRNTNDQNVREESAKDPESRFLGDAMRVEFQILTGLESFQGTGVDGEVEIRLPQAGEAFREFPLEPIRIGSGQSRSVKIEIREISDRLRRAMDSLAADFALQDFRLVMTFFNERSGTQIGAPFGYDFFRLWDALEQDDFAFVPNDFGDVVRRLPRGVEKLPTRVRMLQFPLANQPTTPELRVQSNLTGHVESAVDQGLVITSIAPFPAPSRADGDLDRFDLKVTENFQLQASINGQRLVAYEFEQVQRPSTTFVLDQPLNREFAPTFANAVDAAVEQLAVQQRQIQSVLSRVSELRTEIENAVTLKAATLLEGIFGSDLAILSGSGSSTRGRDIAIGYSRGSDNDLGSVRRVGSDVDRLTDFFDQLPDTQLGRNLELSHMLDDPNLERREFDSLVFVSIAPHLSQRNLSEEEVASIINDFMTDEEIVDRLSSALSNSALSMVFRVLGLPQAGGTDETARRHSVVSHGFLAEEIHFGGELEPFDARPSLNLDAQRMPDSFRFMQFAFRDRYALIDDQFEVVAENLDRQGDLLGYLNRALTVDPRKGFNVLVEQEGFDNTSNFDPIAPPRDREPVSITIPSVGPLTESQVEVRVNDDQDETTIPLDISNDTNEDRTVSSISIGDGINEVFSLENLNVGDRIPANSFVSAEIKAIRPEDIQITSPQASISIVFDDDSELEFGVLGTVEPEVDFTFSFDGSIPDGGLVVLLTHEGSTDQTIVGAQAVLGESKLDGVPDDFSAIDAFTPTITDTTGAISIQLFEDLDPEEDPTLGDGDTIAFRVDNTGGDRGRFDLAILGQDGSESIASVTIPLITLDDPEGDEQIPFEVIEDGNDAILIETPSLDGSTTNEFRLWSDPGGNFEINLPEFTDFTVSAFDPTTGTVGVITGTTEASGQVTTLGDFVFSVPRGVDLDGDGLISIVERILGTSDLNPDSNDDGIDDFQAIQLGLDPASGASFPSGVIAAIELSGDAREVVSVGRIDELESQTSFVATGDFGLSIIDTTRFDAPVILSEIDLPGFNADVAVDTTRDLAVIAGAGAGLHFVDISDSLVPVLIESVPLTGGANRVEIFDGVAYVASGTNLVAVDLLTRRVVQDIDLGGVDLTDVVREGNRLYTMDSLGRLTVLSVDGLSARVRGSVSAVDGGGKISVGDDLLIATSRTTGGYATVDVSDPDAPTPISGVDGGVDLPEVDTVASGSGLNLTVGQIPTGAFDLVLTDGSDPQVTDSFLASFSLPDRPHDLEVAGGVALVANGAAGLQIVNFQPFDVGDLEPTVVISTDLDLDPTVVGIQILEGTSIPIAAIANDDVHVRNVQLLVNGEVVENDVSFPYDFTPPAIGNGTIEIVLVATDTGFNTAVSDPLVIDIIPDTFAPQLLETSPAEGAIEAAGQQLITLTFDEPLDVATVSEADISIVDGDGATVAVDAIDFRVDDSIVRILTESLEAGTYDVTFALDGITDRAGNLGEGDATFQFDILDFQPDVFWVGQSGEWSDAANWSTGQVPGPNDAVLISVPGDVTVTLENEQQTVRRLLVTERLELDRDTSGPTDLTITEDAFLNGEILMTGITNAFFGDRVPRLIVQGDLVNNGVFEWSGGEIIGAGGTWTNRGTVNISGGGLFKRASALTLLNEGTIDQQVNTDVDLPSIQNIGTYRIAGGDIDRVGSTATFTNDGTLRATGAGDIRVSIGFINRGLVEIDGGRVVMTGLTDPQDGGVFDISQNATLEFRNSLNVNNTITFQGSGNVLASTNGQDLTLNAGATLVNNLTGGFTFDASSGSSDIEFLGSGTIQNNGVMTLNEFNLSSNNTRIENSETLTLVNFNFQNGILENSGTTTFVSGISNLASDGRLDNLAAGNFLMESGRLQGAGEVRNAGRFVKTTNAAARVSTAFADLGGTIDIVEGTLEFTSDVNLDGGGTLQGRGTFSGNVTNSNGVVAPGTSPGLLNIDGDYTQLAGGLLFVEIGGISVGDEFDRLRVTGAVNLSGSLKVEVLDGFVPDATDRFAVLEYGSLTGDFDSLDSDSIDNVITNFLADVLELQLS